jgi:hypothetical protein
MLIMTADLAELAEMGKKMMEEAHKKGIYKCTCTWCFVSKSIITWRGYNRRAIAALKECIQCCRVYC